MLNVVFDTNVYISALNIPGSKAEEAYLLAVDRKIRLFTSVAILTETARKLREKFQWDDENITAALKHISKVATVLKPGVKINILKDCPDNRILECAKAAGADLIVTGDKHLLELKNYELIGITNIAGFLRSMPKERDLKEDTPDLKGMEDRISEAATGYSASSRKRKTRLHR